MIRTRAFLLVIALLSGCIAPPNVIGETAEDGGASGDDESGEVDDGEVDDGGVDDGAEDDGATSSPIDPDPCEMGCEGVVWTTVLDQPAHALELATTVTPVVLYAPADTQPLWQGFSAAGAATNTATTIDVANEGRFAQFAIGATGHAALAYVVDDDRLFEVHRLGDDLATTMWTAQGSDDGDGPTHHFVDSLQIATDGAVRLTTTYAYGGDWHGSGVWYLRDDGVSNGSSGMFTAPRAFGTYLVGDPDDPSQVVFASGWGPGPVGEAPYRHWARNDVPSNTNWVHDASLDFVGVDLLAPVPFVGGYAAAGKATIEGGVWLQFLDADFVPGAPVFDQPPPEDVQPVPVQMAASSDQVLVFATETTGDIQSLTLRVYDVNAALVSVLDLGFASAESTVAALLDVAVGDDDSVYVLGRDGLVDGGTVDWLRRVAL
jgi:hypothetical protein